MKPNIEHSQLTTLLHYDPATGEFTQKMRWWNREPGDKPGCKTPQGYWYLGVGGKQYPAHRLAWFYVYGEWPQRPIDHINQIKTDNRIANLRMATYSANAHNTALRSTNRTGVKGVSLRQLRNGKRPDKAWVASIRINGKSKYLGVFSTVAEAAEARAAAEIQLYDRGVGR
jgi:hypothetical protein